MLDNKSAVCNILNILFIICLFLLVKILFKVKKELVLPSIIFIFPVLFLALVGLLENSTIFLQERYYTFALVGLTPMVGQMLSANWEKRVNRIIIILFFSILVMNSLLVINGLGWENVSVPRTKNACLWIRQELQQGRTAIITFNRRARVLPMAFYLDKNTVIAPINDFDELKNSFREFGTNINTVFVVEPVFEYQNNYPIEAQSSGKEILDTGFVLKEKRDFGNDRIKVIKLIRVKG